MWHQRLHWVTHSLIGVLVIAGSLALLGCGGGDDNGSSQSQGQGQGPSVVFLDPAVDRVNLNPTNTAILAGRVDPDGTIVSPRGIVTDASTFAFDAIVAPGQVEVLITNVRPVTFNAAGAIIGPPPSNLQVNPPFTTATTGTGVVASGGLPLSVIACPSAFGAVGGATNPNGLSVAASPIGVADYEIFREIDGAVFTGTLCIGAGTATGPNQGGNICVWTNFANSQNAPGAQTIHTSCRIGLGTKVNPAGGGNAGLPVGDPAGGQGVFVMTVTQQRTNVAVQSQPVDVTLFAIDNGNRTATILANSVTGVPINSGLLVDIPTGNP